MPGKSNEYLLNSHDLYLVCKYLYSWYSLIKDVPEEKMFLNLT